MSRVLHHGIGLTLVCVLLILAKAVSAQEGGGASWQHAQLGIGGPLLETTIVAFQLQGPGPRDHLMVNDLDILLTNDGYRLVPLLRLLGFLRVEVKQHGDSLKFQPPSATTRILDFRQGRVLFLNQFEQTLALQLGISDATGEPEIYVADTLAAQLLAIPLQWNQSRYEYTSQTDQIFGVFAENYRPRPSLLSYVQQAEEITVPLPEVMPPAEPTSSSDLLTFVQLRVLGSANGLQNPSATAVRRSALVAMNYSMHPQLQIWGRLFGGNYSWEVAKNWIYPRSSYRPTTHFRGEWTKRVANVGVTLGDNNVGLGDLIFPYLALRGIAFGGASGVKMRRPGRTGLEVRQLISPIHVFEGYAPLASKVELYINGRLYDQRDVREEVNAPSGKGSYRFDGVNLLTGYSNDVLIVIKRPDGLRDEIHREVLGTERLLQGGEWALVGGIGKQRVWSFGGDRTYGFFAGARLLYGLNRRMTVGLTGAFQRDINRAIALFSFSGSEIRQPPSQSSHAGAELAIRLNDHMITSGEVVSSLARADSVLHFGGQFGAEIQFGQLRFEPRIFRFEPGFYNGVNPELQDREGYSLRSYWALSRQWRLQFSVGKIRDNVWKQLAKTTRANFHQTTFSLSGVIPRTNLNMVAERRQHSDQPEQMTYSIETSTWLPWHFNLSTRCTFGDDQLSFSSRDLFSVPSMGYLPFYESRGLLFNLNWDPLSPSNVSVSHWQSSGFERSLLTYSYGSPFSQRWQTRIEIGRDWERGDYFGQGRIEYSLDTWGENRVGLLSRFQGFWSVEFVFQLQNLFSLYRGGINRLSNTRLEPGVGGVWGRTFLDLNANGVPDSGEPGLSGIDVIVNDQWGTKTKSNKNGLFFIAMNSPEDSLRISLSAKSLPAIYTVTQGTQLARLESGAFTRVFLGVASLGSISGRVYERTSEDHLHGVSGLRVILVRADSLQRYGESITAEDGGYYIGEVRPGEYLLTIDARSLPPGYSIERGTIPAQERFAETPEIMPHLGIEPERFPNYVIRKVRMTSGITPVDLELLDFILVHE